VCTDSSLPESERNKIAIGSSGLVLGIIIAAAGLIYYKKKSTGQFRFKSFRLILVCVHHSCTCIFLFQDVFIFALTGRILVPN